MTANGPLVMNFAPDGSWHTSSSHQSLANSLGSKPKRAAKVRKCGWTKATMGVRVSFISPSVYKGGWDKNGHTPQEFVK